MADDKQPLPPVATKGKTMERVERGMRAETTGGDTYARSRGNYKKGDDAPEPYPFDF